MAFIKKVYVIITIITILLLGIGFITYIKFSNATEILVNTNNPDLGLYNIKGLLSDINQLENKAKSYTITKDTNYLSDYLYLLGKINRDNKRVKIKALDSLIDKKILLLDKLILLQEEFNEADGMSKVLDNVSSQENNKGILGIFKAKSKIDTQDLSHTISIIQKQQDKQRKDIIEQEKLILEKENLVNTDINQLINQFEIDTQISLQKNTFLTNRAISETKFIIFSISLAILSLLISLVVVIVNYVNSNRKYRKRIRSEKKRAEELAQSKERFLATMSHEIRTPMNAVVGFIDQIAKGPLNEEQREHIGVVQTSTDHLLYIINDILALTKLEAGKLQLEQTGFKPLNVFNEVCSSSNQLVKNKNIKLIKEFTLDENLILIGDSHRLKQIILNLLGNAIKFTEQGKIRIIATMLKENETNASLQFSVTDSGIGMNEEELSKVFEEFQQADSNISRTYGGTGLGLTITHKLVLLHHGSINVWSEPQIGTTVTVTIPYPIGSKNDLVEKKTVDFNKEQFKQINTLIVDDELFNRKLLGTILNKYKIKFTEATNGQEAIDLVKKNTYDLVLMDNYMPVMDGVEASIQIRSMEEEQKRNIPIIVLSAAVTKEDVMNYKTAGINGFLAKPYKENDLLQALNKVISSKDFSFLTVKKEDDKQPEKQPISFDSLRELSQGDKDFYKDMVLTFKNSSVQTLQKLNDSAKNEDWEGVANYSHKLRTPFLHLNAHQIGDQLKILEIKCRKKLNVEDIPLMVDEINQEINQAIVFANNELGNI